MNETRRRASSYAGGGVEGRGDLASLEPVVVMTNHRSHFDIPALVAAQAGVPILPACITGSDRIHRKGSLRIDSGVIRVRYGDPSPTEERDLDPLKREVREAIEAGLRASVTSA